MKPPPSEKNSDIKKVLCNSHNLIDPHHILVIGLRNSTLFTRPFLAGRHTHAHTHTHTHTHTHIHIHTCVTHTMYTHTPKAQLTHTAYTQIT